MTENWRARMQEWPCLVPDFTLSPGSTSLVLVDMQRCFLEPDIGLGALLQTQFQGPAAYYHRRLTDVVLPNVRRLLSEFRTRKMRVVHITVGSELPDGRDFSPLRRVANDQADRRFKAIFQRGSPEHAIVEGLAPLNDELVLNKTTRSAFNSTPLEMTLRNLNIDGLIVCGVQTNACVESTARDAADLGFKCVIVDDACQCFSPLTHDGTMMSFASLFGKVWEAADVLRWLESTG